MFSNARALKCNTAQLWTCGVCFERPMFFGKEKLEDHYRRQHGKRTTKNDETLTFYAEQLQAMETSKERLVNQLEEIKSELSNLQQNGLAKKRTLTIVHNEIANIHEQIAAKDSEIQRLRASIQNTTGYGKADYQPLLAFKDKLDTEYTCLVNSVGEQAIAGIENTISNRNTTEERLARLEADMEQLKKTSFEKQQTLTEDTNQQQSPKVITNLEDALRRKEGELETCMDCIDKFKVALDKKENEVELIKELNGRYQQSEKLNCTAQESLQQQLDHVSCAHQEMLHKNQTLGKDLNDTLASLKSAEKLVSKLTKEKGNLEREAKKSLVKLEGLEREIATLKDGTSGMNQRFKEKHQILEEQLSIAVKDLNEKNEMLIGVEQQRNINQGQVSSLKDEIACLLKEKNELGMLVKEMAISKQREEELEKALKNFEEERKRLLVENQSLNQKLEGVEERRREQNKVISEQKECIENMRTEKDELHQQVKNETIKRDSVNQELTRITNEHGKCNQSIRDLKVSYERSLQDIRYQAEHLLKEESQLSIRLEKELEVKEKEFRREKEEYERQITSSRSVEDALKKDLEAAQYQQKTDQQQIKKMEGEKVNLREMVDALKVNLEAAQYQHQTDQQQIKKIKGEEASLRERVEALKKDVDDEQKQLKEIEGEKASLREAVKSLKEDLEADQEQIKKMELEKAILQERIQVLEEESDRDKETILQNEERVHDLERMVQEQAQEVDTALVMKEVELLKTENIELQQQLQKEENEVSVLNDKIHGIENLLAETELIHKTEVNELRDEFQKNQQDLENELQNQKESLQQLQHQAQEIEQQSEDEKQIMKQQLQNLEQLLSNSECEKTALVNEREQLEDQLAERTEDLEQKTTDVCQQKEDFETKMSQLDETVATLTSQMGGQKSKYEQEIESLKNTIEELNKKAQTNNNERKLQKENEKLTRDNDNLMLDLFYKKEQEKQHREEVNKLRARLESKAEELPEVSKVDSSKDVTRLEGQLKTSEEKIIGLSKSLFEVQQNYNDSVVEYDLISKKLKDTETDFDREIRHLQSELKKQNEDAVQSEKEKTSSENELQRIQSELCEKARDIEAISEQQKQLQEKFETTQQQAESYKIENSKLQSNLDEKISLNQDLEQKLLVAEEDLQVLKNNKIANQSSQIEALDIVTDEVSSDQKIVNKVASQSSHIQTSDISTNEAPSDKKNDNTVTNDIKDGEEEYSYSFDDHSSTTSSVSSSSSRSVSPTNSNKSDGRASTRSINDEESEHSISGQAKDKSTSSLSRSASQTSNKSEGRASPRSFNDEESQHSGRDHSTRNTDTSVSASSSSSRSISQTSASHVTSSNGKDSPIKSDELKSKPSKCTSNNDSKSIDRDETDISITEDIDTLPLDDDDDEVDAGLSEDENNNNDDDLFSDDGDDFYGTKLTRKPTVDMHNQQSIGDNASDSDDENDVHIPTRKWGENFLSGVEQTIDEELGEVSIDEELGEVCDESVASLDSSISNAKKDNLIEARSSSLFTKSDKTADNTKEDMVEKNTSEMLDSNNVSIKDVVKTSSQSSIDEENSSKSSSSVSGKSNTKSKKKKKKTNKKKSRESLTTLAPLSGGLPPLKGKPLLGDLPPLRGLPPATVRTIQVKPMAVETDTTNQEVAEQSNLNAPSNETIKQQASSKAIPATVRTIQVKPMATETKTTHQEIAALSNLNKPSNEKIKPVKSQASSKLISTAQSAVGQKLQATNSGIKVKSNASQKEVNLTKRSSLLGDLPSLSNSTSSSQMNNVLGDLPPLPGCKPSAFTMKNVLGGNVSDSDEGDSSFGNDDIDALLQDLDDFDTTKKSNK